MDGLSPLARGTRYFGTVTEALERFIPAGAGNSLSATISIARKTVYPRWRGELTLSYCFVTTIGNTEPTLLLAPAQ